MPDFEAAIILGTGVALATWADPAVAGKPSRLNPNPTHPPKYVKVTPGAAGGGLTTVIARATVGGVVAPVDGALGGRLFQWCWVESSGPWPLMITPTAGKTSEATIHVPTTHLGHFALLCARDTGGAVVLHFDQEA